MSKAAIDHQQLESLTREELIAVRLRARGVL